jgi:hypothetical protein
MSELGFISLHQVPGMLPVARSGKVVSISSVYRWSQRGIRGVVLKTVQVGNVRATTREWLQEFFVGISLHRKDSSSNEESVSDRRRAAERILDRAGIKADKPERRRD